MNNRLHIELEKQQTSEFSFSQGILTLNKAGDFTVQVSEFLEYQQRKLKYDLLKEKGLVNVSIEKESADLKTLEKKFDAVNWIWNSVYSLQNMGTGHNQFVKKGITFLGKTFTFPTVLEGGGYCYVEAFFDGESSIGKIPNGLLVRAIGVPKIIRVEWTDRQYNPIKESKVSFGSQLLLHIYTEGLYGQEILIGLKDVNGLNKDLNIANSDFFEREVKAYPVRPFEENHKGVSSLLVKADNPEEAVSSIQKAVIEVSVDFNWMLDQKLDFVGNFGKELEIEVSIKQKTTGKNIEIEDDNDVLNISLNQGVKHDFTKDVANKPVLVGEIDTVAKDPKKAIDFTFGIFLDGTLNNMYDTEVRQLAEGKARADTTGIAITPDKAKKIVAKHGDKDYEESSYENDLSNPAILFKNYKENINNKSFKIYTEGIGTNTAPEEQGVDLREEDYKKDDMMQGPAFGMGSAGIMDRVKKSINDVVKMITDQNLDDGYCVGTITFDVFGFSRGAAAARHFVHVVTHGPYRPHTDYDRDANAWVYDLQGNNISAKYAGKVMPQFGVLGQLLTDAELMDDTMTKVNVRFVGIYDTVPHHGLFQHNDIKDLGLDHVNRADYVVHMIAGDEYRANFSLVNISSVSKISPYNGNKGGMELIYPGVHCDVGGAYVEGGGNHPYRINIANNTEDLEKEKKEFTRQGWFKEEELSIKFYSSGVFFATAIGAATAGTATTAATLATNYYRLEGFKKNVSNQYSYIPLHLMADFCDIRGLPIKEDDIINIGKYRFTANFIDKIPQIKYKNVEFLEAMKIKMRNYTFENSDAVTFDSYPEDITFLRYHYLHWNATYGDPHESKGTWLSGKNKPNMDKNGIRKRDVL